MKLEIDVETKEAVYAVCIAATVCLICHLVYRYNALAYEKGYTQKQMEYSQQTIWVKQ